MRSADLIVHYEVFYYGVAPHYEPHSSTSVEMEVARGEQMEAAGAEANMVVQAAGMAAEKASLEAKVDTVEGKAAGTAGGLRERRHEPSTWPLCAVKTVAKLQRFIPLR